MAPASPRVKDLLAAFEPRSSTVQKLASIYSSGKKQGSEATRGKGRNNSTSNNSSSSKQEDQATQLSSAGSAPPTPSGTRAAGPGEDLDLDVGPLTCGPKATSARRKLEVGPEGESDAWEAEGQSKGQKEGGNASACGADEGAEALPCPDGLNVESPLAKAEGEGEGAVTMLDGESTTTAGPGGVGAEIHPAEVHVEGVEGLEGMTLEEVEVLWEVWQEEEQVEGEGNKETERQQVDVGGGKGGDQEAEVIEGKKNKGSGGKKGQRRQLSVDVGGGESGCASSSSPKESKEEAKDRTSPDSLSFGPFCTSSSSGFELEHNNSSAELALLDQSDLGCLVADASRKRAELAELETEIARRRGELSKIRVEAASATSEKVQVDSQLKRLKKELQDWSLPDEETSKKLPEHDASQEAPGKAGEFKADISSAVIRAKLARARHEMDIMRKRERSAQQDVEYLEKKFAQERKESMELRRKLGEARTARRDAEKELQRLRPQAALLQKAASHLQKRLMAEEEGASLLRQQLQKAQTAELELLKQVQLAAQEAALLRKSSLLTNGGRGVGGDFGTELEQQLHKNSELETKFAEQKQEVVRLQMKVFEEEEKRKEAERALSRVQHGTLETEIEKSSEAVAEGGSREQSTPTWPMSQSVNASGLRNPTDRILNLLDQVESAKTSGMPEKDELVRLQWLTGCLRDELLKARNETSNSSNNASSSNNGSSSSNSTSSEGSQQQHGPEVAVSAVPGVQEPAAAKAGRFSGPIGGRQVVQTRGSKAAHKRTLSSVIVLPGRTVKADKGDVGSKKLDGDGKGDKGAESDNNDKPTGTAEGTAGNGSEDKAPSASAAAAAAAQLGSSTDAKTGHVSSARPGILRIPSKLAAGSSEVGAGSSGKSLPSPSPSPSATPRTMFARWLSGTARGTSAEAGGEAQVHPWKTNAAEETDSTAAGRSATMKKSASFNKAPRK